MVPNDSRLFMSWRRRGDGDEVCVSSTENRDHISTDIKYFPRIAVHDDALASGRKCTSQIPDLRSQISGRTMLDDKVSRHR